MSATIRPCATAATLGVAVLALVVSCAAPEGGSGLPPDIPASPDAQVQPTEVQLSASEVFDAGLGDEPPRAHYEIPGVGPAAYGEVPDIDAALALEAEEDAEPGAAEFDAGEAQTGQR
jgi:hypothetical protein